MRDIDDLVEEWHEGPDDGVQLHEFLGITWEQYALWTRDGVDPREPCKHCDRRIEARGHDYWVHREGPQINKVTCELEPYGYHAEPVGLACDDNPVNPCNGAR